MKRLILFSGVCLMAALTPTLAFSDIVMNIWDDGTDLYMSATGDYDLTNATLGPNASLSVNAAVYPSSGNGFFGWETGTAQGYLATFNGIMSGTGTFPATFTSTTNPFFFYQGASTIVTPGPLTGSVNEFARFDGLTLASLFMVKGETVSVSWGNGGVNERGSISTVPEPTSTLILVSLGFVGLVSKRRRKV